MRCALLRPCVKSKVCVFVCMVVVVVEVLYFISITPQRFSLFA
jgi:hypothetical protein